MKTIHAIYERGIFRPLETVELPERCEVEFEPRPVKPTKENDENLSAIYTILSERYESGEYDVAVNCLAISQWCPDGSTILPIRQP